MQRLVIVYGWILCITFLKSTKQQSRSNSFESNFLCEDVEGWVMIWYEIGMSIVMVIFNPLLCWCWCWCWCGRGYGCSWEWVWICLCSNHVMSELQNMKPIIIIPIHVVNESWTCGLYCVLDEFYIIIVWTQWVHI